MHQCPQPLRVIVTQPGGEPGKNTDRGQLVREASRHCKPHDTPGTAHLVVGKRLLTVFPVQWLKPRQGSHWLIPVSILMGDGHPVAVRIDLVVHLNLIHGLPGVGDKIANHGGRRAGFRRREPGQGEVAIAAGGGDFRAIDAGELGRPMSGQQKVVQVSRHIGPEPQSVALPIENAFALTVRLQGPDLQVAAKHTEVHIRGALHERRRHHRAVAIAPLQRHGAITVVPDIGIEAIKLTVGNGNTIKHFGQGLGHRVGHTLFLDSQTGGYAHQPHPALGDSGHQGVRRDVSGAVGIIHPVRTKKGDIAPPAVGHGGLAGGRSDDARLQRQWLHHTATGGNLRFHHPGAGQPGLLTLLLTLVALWLNAEAHRAGTMLPRRLATRQHNAQHHYTEYHSRP